MADAHDAIALLKADHRKVEDLFAKFEAAREADKKQRLAKQICTELTVHTILEEEIFYPACEGEIEDGLVSEGYVEHDAAKVLIAELEAGSPTKNFTTPRSRYCPSKSSTTCTKKKNGRKGFLPRRARLGSTWMPLVLACYRESKS